MCAALDEAARDADLFLVEASFLEGEDNPPDLHLTGKEAGRDGHPRGGATGRSSPTCRRGTTGRGCSTRRCGGYAGPLELAVAGATYEV